MRNLDFETLLNAAETNGQFASATAESSYTIQRRTNAKTAFDIGVLEIRRGSTIIGTYEDDVYGSGRLKLNSGISVEVRESSAVRFITLTSEGETLTPEALIVLSELEKKD